MFSLFFVPNKERNKCTHQNHADINLGLDRGCSRLGLASVAFYKDRALLVSLVLSFQFTSCFPFVIVLHVYHGSLGNWIGATPPAHRAKCTHTKGKIP